jgi:hypothetical protein
LRKVAKIGIAKPVIVVLGVHLNRQRISLEVRFARRPLPELSGLVQGRHENGQQKGDNGNYYQQFY